MTCFFFYFKKIKYILRIQFTNSLFIKLMLLNPTMGLYHTPMKMLIFSIKTSLDVFLKNSYK